MCILITTNAHPHFPFVLCSNRDEYLSRATAPAHLHEYAQTTILSPLDMARVDHGTWIALNPATAKLAVLVNYREGMKLEVNPVSRGVLPLEYVTSLARSRTEFLNELRGKYGSDVLEEIGGFSLMFGTIGERFDIISNKNGDDFKCFIDKEVHGLSNSKFDEPWEKVKLGERGLKSIVDEAKEDKETVIEDLLSLLSTNTLDNMTDDFEANFHNIEKTIFVPPLLVRDYTRGNPLAGKYYGTRTQTVILLDKNGQLTYIERNLHTSDDLTEEPMTQRFDMKIPYEQ